MKQRKMQMQEFKVKISLYSKKAGRLIYLISFLVILLMSLTFSNILIEILIILAFLIFSMPWFIFRFIHLSNNVIVISGIFKSDIVKSLDSFESVKQISLSKNIFEIRFKDSNRYLFIGSNLGRLRMLIEKCSKQAG